MFLLEAASQFVMAFGDFFWVEMIYSAFGSLVGFVIPLGADAIANRISDKNRLTAIRNSINSELFGIKTALMEIIDEDNQMGNPAGIICRTLEAECIVWDSVKSSDTFIELIYRKSSDYSKLISIYNKLVYLNKYEDRYDLMLVNNSTFDRVPLVEDIRTLRSQVVELITEYEAAYAEEKNNL